MNKPEAYEGELTIKVYDLGGELVPEIIPHMPVSDAELSVRSRNYLKKMGIVTIGDLTRHSTDELQDKFFSVPTKNGDNRLARFDLFIGEIMEQLKKAELKLRDYK